MIYFYHDRDRPLYLLFAYAKTQAGDMSPDEKKAVTALVAAITGQG